MPLTCVEWLDGTAMWYTNEDGNSCDGYFVSLFSLVLGV